MADEYPYPGCCPHGFNAHKRDHCTACDCVKPPTRVEQPPTPEAPTAPGIMAESDLVAGTNVRECSLCWGLIVEESREKHLAFHEKTIETTHRLLMIASHVERKRNRTDERD